MVSDLVPWCNAGAIALANLANNINGTVRVLKYPRVYYVYNVQLNNKIITIFYKFLRNQNRKE